MPKVISRTAPLTASALLQLMWLASPALPVGGFSYSEGLEAAVDTGRISDEASATGWIVDQLQLTLARADLAVVASALYLVKVSYDSRRQFALLEGERMQTRQLEQDAEKLRLQLRAQATHLRVDLIAREKLKMSVATPAVTQYLDAASASRTGGRP